MSPARHLTLDPSHPLPPTRDHSDTGISTYMPDAKETKVHPTISGAENASLYFVGTATIILCWAGVRLMTDPNFLYKKLFSHTANVVNFFLSNVNANLHFVQGIQVTTCTWDLE
jgi:hypothetical protein